MYVLIHDMDTGWRGGKGGWDSLGNWDGHTLPCVEQITSGKLLYGTGSSTRCSVMT